MKSAKKTNTKKLDQSGSKKKKMTMALKIFNNSKKATKGHMKPKIDNGKSKQTKNKDTSNTNNINENLVKNIKDNPKLIEKISYMQLWWKTIFQIIKIQKYLRGFLYRVKLLKILENREKILYGIIQMSKSLKTIMYKKVVRQIKRSLLAKQKYYFNIWNNFIIRKKIIQKLKHFDKKNIKPKNLKTDRDINEKKFKSSSMAKRDLLKEKKKDNLEGTKMRNKDKDKDKDKNQTKEDLNLSSKKNGLETARINTERNIHKPGLKNNSLEKRKSKKSFKNIFNNNLKNIKSNADLKQNKNNTHNKKQCQNHKTSSNLLMNKSQNNLNNYKFVNKMKLNNKGKLSKKNTNVKKSNNISNKNRNKKNVSDVLNVNSNLKNYKSYFLESRNTIKKHDNNHNKSIKLKKNYELEYISTHQNRFHCPKQIYSLNKKSDNKNSSVIIDKLDMSFELKKESNTLKSDESKSHLRPRSMQNRNKKKYKSFVENIHFHNDNKISKEYNTSRNLNVNPNINNFDSPKKEEKKKIMKSKTKIMKKGKKKKNQKGGKPKSTKNKNTKKMSLLNLWRTKNIKKKILNKLRSISILNNKLKLHFYKSFGNTFIKSLQNMRKFKILSNYFNRYKNKINRKIILQKLKENNMKEKEIEFMNNVNVNTESKINGKENISIKTDKNKIIEISPYQNTKTIRKIDHIKNKLKNLLVIKQKLVDNVIKKKYIYKWKIINLYEETPTPNLITDNNNNNNFNRRGYYYNYRKNIVNNNPRNNSSYHRKRVKYQNNNTNNIETSFEEEKKYSRKIVSYLNNNNLSVVNKDDYINRSQNQINPYEHYSNNYNNFHNKCINSTININISSPIEELINNGNNNNTINYKSSNNHNLNVIQKNPSTVTGIYKRKRIINTKNGNITKNMNESCVIGEINKSQFELNNTANENEKDFMNNSVVIRRRGVHNNNYNEKDIYYPKHVNPNLLENSNQSNVEITKMFIKEQAEFLINNNFVNNNGNIAYKKINIRYQKMYGDNDLISEHRHINFGLLDEQTNEGTNSYLKKDV